MRISLPLIPLALLLLVPAGLLRSEMCLVVETGFETDSSVKSSVAIPLREEYLAPGTGTGSVPEDEGVSWANLDVVSSRASHAALRAAWGAKIGDGLSLSLSAGLEFADRDMTMFAEEWVYLPFWPGSPTLRNGGGNIELSSTAWTPHVLASLKWSVTSRISVGVEAGWGYSFEEYEDFDFFTPMHQVMVGVDAIESITCKNSYKAQRWQLGASIGYAISDRWTASVGYQFLMLEDLWLKNSVQTPDINRYVYSLPLLDRKSQRVAFSVTCRF